MTHRNLIAVLRGIQPDEVEEIGRVLLDAGFEDLEVPLNSPNPFESIRILVDIFGGRGNFGAGTVLRVEEIEKIKAVGGKLVVSPNCDTSVIRATKSAGMVSCPGVLTPTEAIAALHAGADRLKFFPGHVIGPDGLKAIRAVLPSNTQCYAVGGAKESNFEAWVSAGANGFGIGGNLYSPGMDSAAVSKRAASIVAAYDRVLG